jgi:hypothetical protein
VIKGGKRDKKNLPMIDLHVFSTREPWQGDTKHTNHKSLRSYIQYLCYNTIKR